MTRLLFYSILLVSMLPKYIFNFFTDFFIVSFRNTGNRCQITENCYLPVFYLAAVKLPYFVRAFQDDSQYLFIS